MRRRTDAARDSARSPRSAAERHARQTSLAWTSPANAQLRRNRPACPTPAPLSRPTIRDGRPRRPTSSFCAVWLSSTSGSHAVATPNGRRTRPQQSRARRWRRHRRRQFSHPRIAVRIQQSPASLPAVVRSGSGDHHDRIAVGAATLVLASRRAFGKRTARIRLPLPGEAELSTHRVLGLVDFVPQQKRFPVASRLPLSPPDRLLGAPLRANANASTSEWRPAAHRQRGSARSCSTPSVSYSGRHADCRFACESGHGCGRERGAVETHPNRQPIRGSVVLPLRRSCLLVVRQQQATPTGVASSREQQRPRRASLSAAAGGECHRGPRRPLA